MNQCTNQYKKLSKEIKSDKYCYSKVRRAITVRGVIEKSSILRILGAPILFSPFVVNTQNAKQ